MSIVNRFKKNRDAMKSRARAASEAENQKTDYSSKDEHLWSPTFNKEKGVATATIRFLPWNEDELSWVKIYNHGFQGPTGKWYIENCLTTVGKDDPCTELNKRLWDSGVESDKTIARDQKRKLSYYANILVVKDKENPEAEGEVFVYRFGKKIFDKLQAQLVSEYGEEAEECDVFDIIEGKPFNLRAKKVDGYWNYDDSSFGEMSPIAETEDEMEVILNKTHNIKDLYVSEKKFKTYDELKQRLFEVLGPVVGSGIEVVVGWGDDAPAPKEKDTPKPKAKPSPKAKSVPEDSDTDEGLSDDLDAMLEDLDL